MDFLSTRNNKLRVKGCDVILKGISEDGGLFVPETFPQYSMADIKALAGMDYAQVSAELILKFIPELDRIQLYEYCNAAAEKFEDGDPAPVIKIDDEIFTCELWHGPTHAFKDIALTQLPYLMRLAKNKCGVKDETLILVATSGDTGKAALEGFKDVAGTKIMVLYPEDGVSAMQKAQMTAQQGGNVCVAGIKGNFDEAQGAVKEIFTDPDTAARLAGDGISLSSANSINFGRLVPQIVYYFTSYVSLALSKEIAWGDQINFCVPTGNFGNILAGYYARRMGLPIGKLICASNRNNVLTEFFSKGEYSTARSFYKTMSPSMDILVSSNLERLIFELSGRDSALTARRMEELRDNRRYTVTDAELAAASEIFLAYWADEDKTKKALFETFDEYGYITDTHTAVAFSAMYQHLKATADKTKTVIISTASPHKFPADVLTALKRKPDINPFKALRQLERQTALPIPNSLTDLEYVLPRFAEVLERGAIKDAVLKFAKK